MKSAIELEVNRKDKERYLNNIVEAIEKVNTKDLNPIKNVLSVYKLASKYTDLYNSIKIDTNYGFPVNKYIKRVFNEKNRRIVSDINVEKKIKEYLRNEIGLDNIKKQIGVRLYKEKIDLIDLKKDINFFNNKQGNLKINLYKNKPIIVNVKYNIEDQIKIDNLLNRYKDEELKHLPKYLTTILDLFYEENSINIKKVEKKEYNFLNYLTEANGNLPEESSSQLLLLLKENVDSYILKQKTSILDISEIVEYRRKYLFFKEENKSLKKNINEKNLFICNSKIYNEVLKISADSNDEVIS
jgi:hypothetical protein